MLVIFLKASFRRFIVFLNCILSKNIILTIMDFKISDTNKGKKSLEHSRNIYRIDAVLKSG